MGRRAAGQGPPGFSALVENGHSRSSGERHVGHQGAWVPLILPRVPPAVPAFVSLKNRPPYQYEYLNPFVDALPKALQGFQGREQCYSDEGVNDMPLGAFLMLFYWCSILAISCFLTENDC